jgi:uncharacterized membrane protein
MAQWTEEEIEVRMGTLLKWGVILATVVMLTGAVVFLFHNGRNVPDYKTFRNIKQGEGSSLIRLAVLLIIATPVARVIFAAYAFARMQDWLYALISTTVLALLLFAIFHRAV